MDANTRVASRLDHPRTPRCCFRLAWILLIVPSAVQADLVGVDFNWDGGGFVLESPIATYSGAAVLGAAGDQWNRVLGSFSGTTQSPVALVDSTGVPSGVTLTFSSAVRSFDAFFNNDKPLFTPIENNLMRDYMFVPQSQSATLTLGGLTAGGSYRLILYSSSNEPNRATDFTVNMETKRVTQAAASSFIEGVNYADFSAAADGSGNLSFSFVGVGLDSESALNGFQIQAIPEPSSLAMFSLVGLVSLACRSAWRRNFASSATDG